VNRELQFLRKHYPDKQFFKSKEHISPVQRFWTFGEAAAPIAQKITHLINFGFYSKLESDFMIYSHKYRENLTVTNKPRKNQQRRKRARPISISQRIQTIFFISLVLFAVSSCTLVYEIIYGYIKTDRRTILSLKNIM